jgi:propanol-preferring alcohol dehydrogenase
MHAMVLQRLVSLLENSAPLELMEFPVPQPWPGEVRVHIAAYGVCHTGLDEYEGCTPPPTLPIVLGHEVFDRVDSLGEGVTNVSEGQRVGVGWFHSSTSEINENLRSEFRATGHDVNGGYAEYMTVPAEY